MMLGVVKGAWCSEISAEVSAQNVSESIQMSFVSYFERVAYWENTARFSCSYHVSEDTPER